MLWPKPACGKLSSKETSRGSRDTMLSMSPRESPPPTNVGHVLPAPSQVPTTEQSSWDVSVHVLCDLSKTSDSVVSSKLTVTHPPSDSSHPRATRCASAPPAPRVDPGEPHPLCLKADVSPCLAPAHAQGDQLAPWWWWLTGTPSIEGHDICCRCGRPCPLPRCPQCDMVAYE